jgi:low affinity Fe/Cu permease
MMAQATRLKRSPASLFGAFVIAFGIFMLWLLVARELGHGDTTTLAIGLAVAAVVGVWIRVADL